MALKRKRTSEVLTDEENFPTLETNNCQIEVITKSSFTRDNLKRLKSKNCHYKFLENLFDGITLSQPGEINNDNTILHKVFLQKLGKALLFNSNVDNVNNLVCYDYPIHIIKDYGLNKYECFLLLEKFLNSLKRRHKKPKFMCIEKKFRKSSKLIIDINKNHFDQTMYLWIRDKFGIDSTENQTSNNKKLNFLPITIQHCYHSSFVLSMKNMYEDAVLCFLGFPLIKKEFCPFKRFRDGEYSRIETFMFSCSKIIPDIFNFIIYCAMKNHLSEEKRNKFFTHMFNFCKYISNFRRMEKDVLISCIFSVLTYDLHFRPETIYDEYRKIEIKDIYRVRNSMLKYNAFLNISLFIKWKKEEEKSDKLPVFLFEQLKDIVIDGNVMEYMPIFEIFIYLICKFDLLSRYFDLILNAVQKCPTVIPRIAKRFHQENQPHFAGIIERSLEPSADLHSSHESWIKYLNYKSTQINENTDTELLLQDIKIIVRILDYGKWRKSRKIWKLFDEFLFKKINNRDLFLKNFKIFFGERRNWWLKFHSVEVSHKTNVIRTKILNFINELYIS